MSVQVTTTLESSTGDTEGEVKGPVVYTLDVVAAGVTAFLHHTLVSVDATTGVHPEDGTGSMLRDQ